MQVLWRWFIPSGLSRPWVRVYLRWVRPEPGSIWPWRRKCFPSILKSCSQTRSCSGQTSLIINCGQISPTVCPKLPDFIYLPNRQLYKPHAFLLFEEEREQFLFHLLSLNTVDYLCFTHVFTSISKFWKANCKISAAALKLWQWKILFCLSVVRTSRKYLDTVLCGFSLGIPYRVAIIPMKKLSIAMATVNPWVCVSGELGDSGVRPIPKNTQEIFFQVCIQPLA